MPFGVYSVSSYVLVLPLTFLLLYLEPLLGLSVQILQVLWPAALNENILLVVLGGAVVDGQPLLLFIPLWASWGQEERDREKRDEETCDMVCCCVLESSPYVGMDTTHTYYCVSSILP